MAAPRRPFAAPRAVAERALLLMASAGDEADTGEASDDAAFEMELFRVPICAAPEQHAQIVSRTAGRTGFRTRPGSSAHALQASRDCADFP